MPDSYYQRFLTPEQRFWEKVDKNGPIPAHRPSLGACWLWTAGKFSNGYGAFSCDGRQMRAHRFAFFLSGRTFRAKEVTDHLCRQRSCVRASHLEAVTQSQNIIRGMRPTLTLMRTHCPQGHPYDAENTAYSKEGWRMCRNCRSARLREMRRRVHLSNLRA